LAKNKLLHYQSVTCKKTQIPHSPEQKSVENNNKINITACEFKLTRVTVATSVGAFAQLMLSIWEWRKPFHFRILRSQKIY